MRLTFVQSFLVLLAGVGSLTLVSMAQSQSAALSSPSASWSAEEQQDSDAASGKRNANGRAQDMLGPAQRKMAAAAVKFAQAQVGKPYIAGYRGPDAYDCSGLTWAAYAQAGLPWPMSMALSYQQWNPKAYGISTMWTVQVQPGQEKPGDLVFFDWYANASDAPRGLVGPSGVDHVGIVEDAKSGTMIEAANPSVGVVRSSYRTGGNAAHIIGFARVLYR